MVAALIWLAMPVIGWTFGARSHTRRPREGFLLGLVLGPVGLLILAALDPSGAQAADDLDTRGGLGQVPRRGEGRDLQLVQVARDEVAQHSERFDLIAGSPHDPIVVTIDDLQHATLAEETGRSHRGDSEGVETDHGQTVEHPFGEGQLT
jgi:hypothetical protein